MLSENDRLRADDDGLLVLFPRAPALEKAGIAARLHDARLRCNPGRCRPEGRLLSRPLRAKEMVSVSTRSTAMSCR